MLSTAAIMNGSIIKTAVGGCTSVLHQAKQQYKILRVTALSPQSPLGKKLLGLTVSDVAEFNSIPFVIESIV